MNGLFEKGGFEIFKRNEVERKGNVLKSKLAFAIKNIGAKEEYYKTRLVAMRHMDKLKN